MEGCTEDRWPQRGKEDIEETERVEGHRRIEG
jgi:hypothetical protein